MKKVLVTGGAGFIGSHTVDLLLERGCQVRILDSLAPPVHIAGQLPDYVPQDDVEFILGDVRDKRAWERALEGVDAVVHLAAYQDYLPDFSTFFHVNTVGTALLFEVAVERRLPLRKVVVASSQSTYGEAKYRCTHDLCKRNGSCPYKQGLEPWSRYPGLRSEGQLKNGEWEVSCPFYGEVLQWTTADETIINPHNQYAMSKYTQEMVALNLGWRYGIPTTCMRYSITQGPRQSFRNAYSGVLRIFAQRLLNSRPPVCYEDGLQMRDYVSVYDVARANLLVLEHPDADFQVFNVGGDRQISVLDYARLIAHRAGVSIEPQVPGLYRFGDTRHVISDVSKLKGLGWRPKMGLAEIVDGYLDWAQSQKGFRDYYKEAEERMLALGTIRVKDRCLV